MTIPSGLPLQADVVYFCGANSFKALLVDVVGQCDMAKPRSRSLHQLANSAAAEA
jgi:hypothetical protein